MMKELHEYEEKEKTDLQTLEVCKYDRNRYDMQEWYEDEVEEIEKSFAEHLDRCEKELEVSTNIE